MILVLKSYSWPVDQASSYPQAIFFLFLDQFFHRVMGKVTALCGRPYPIKASTLVRIKKSARRLSLRHCWSQIVLRPLTNTWSWLWVFLWFVSSQIAPVRLSVFPSYLSEVAFPVLQVFPINAAINSLLPLSPLLLLGLYSNNPLNWKFIVVLLSFFLSFSVTRDVLRNVLWWFM